ncbi:O-antigen ligase family protein [Ruminococcus flavefaciens]|uniref:O-antigen ligase family protein n=1 Tax=Ruminococcus flavefaciens TaxID=1265 RepID=UPI00048C0E29|nr:O-antigen ligase family protein [Ruminococcus flavefaciens]
MQETKARISRFLELITSERFFYGMIMTVMISLPITEIFDELHSNRFTSQPVIIEMAGYLGVFSIFTHFLKHKGIKIYLSDLLFFAMLIISILSAVFTQNKEATFGGFYYDELLSSFFGYFSLMFAGTMIEDSKLRKNLLKAFVFVTLIQTSAAALQTVGIYNIEAFYDSVITMERKRSYGLLQHSNWYGGLSVLLFACTSGIYLFTKSKATRNIMYAISMLCFYTLLSAEARLAWVGTAGYLFFLVVSLIVMKRKGYDKDKLRSVTKRLALLAVGMAAVIAFVIIVCGKIVDKIQMTSNEISSHNARSVGSNRGYIWKYGLESVPKYWPLGIGLDNYRDVFYLDPDHEPPLTQGKGHNEYIHYLVTQGAFQLIAYLTLLIHGAVTGVRTVIHAEKDEDRIIEWILLGMFFGYTTQALFNSSVVNVAPYFWITLGMCLTKKHQRWLGYKKEKKAKKA